MTNLNDVTVQHSVLVAPYNQIPDYTPELTLPKVISVLYCRLSRDDRLKSKEDDSDSIQNQKLILTKYAQDNRMPGPIFFVDDGISGTTFDRPDVQAALSLVEDGRVKNFVVKDLSRFGRDRLKVDYYHEVMFPELNVRFVALNDNIDSSIGENDMAPVRSLFNEWYARDTSRKVRAVFRAKGMAGEKMTSHAPYGYLKDPQDKKKWVVDEVAAKIVKKIFDLCLSGLGPTHIAHRLRDLKVAKPTAHFIALGVKRINAPPDDPYDWDGTTVSEILCRREYLGHTVNFKTQKKSYKSKKQVHNDPSEYVVFENTHPAIVDQPTFERAQQLRSNGKRRRANSGRVELFSGLVYCADCGSKLSFSSGASLLERQDYYACFGFRSKKRECNNSHYIRAVTLKNMVRDYLEHIKTFVTGNEKAFVRHVTKNAEDKDRQALLTEKKQLAKMERRITEIDSVIRRLYEDNVLSKLTDERFVKLSQGYEQEQKDLESLVGNLKKQVDAQEQQSINVEYFLRLLRKYSDVTELTPKLLHELIEKIEVHAPDKSSGKRVQEITIHLSFIGSIGQLDILNPETAGSAEVEKASPQMEIAGKAMTFDLC